MWFVLTEMRHASEAGARHRKYVSGPFRKSDQAEAGAIAAMGQKEVCAALVLTLTELDEQLGTDYEWERAARATIKPYLKLREAMETDRLAGADQT
jgi:hypothetical protein